MHSAAGFSLFHFQFPVRGGLGREGPQGGERAEQCGVRGGELRPGLRFLGGWGWVKTPWLLASASSGPLCSFAGEVTHVFIPKGPVSLMFLSLMYWPLLSDSDS